MYLLPRKPSWWSRAEIKWQLIISCATNMCSITPFPPSISVGLCSHLLNTHKPWNQAPSAHEHWPGFHGNCMWQHVEITTNSSQQPLKQTGSCSWSPQQQKLQEHNFAYEELHLQLKHNNVHKDPTKIAMGVKQRKLCIPLVVFGASQCLSMLLPLCLYDIL